MNAEVYVPPDAYVAEIVEVGMNDKEFEEQYDEMLNEVYEPIKFGYLTYDPAEVLQAVDPIAYRCGLADYVSSLEEDDEGL